MNVALKTALLSILPISELRGAIPYAISNGIDPSFALVFCVLINFLVVPFGFLFLDYLNKHFLKISFYKKFFHRYIELKRKKFEKHIGTKFEFWALIIFVGAPLPLTGAYSGTLLAWFFNLKRKKSYLAIFLGVLLAGIIVTLTTIGIKSLF